MPASNKVENRNSRDNQSPRDVKVARYARAQTTFERAKHGVTSGIRGDQSLIIRLEFLSAFEHRRVKVASRVRCSRRAKNPISLFFHFAISLSFSPARSGAPGRAGPIVGYASRPPARSSR